MRYHMLLPQCGAHQMSTSVVTLKQADTVMTDSAFLLSGQCSPK
jgi:hypothetical protein